MRPAPWPPHAATEARVLKATHLIQKATHLEFWGAFATMRPGGCRSLLSNLCEGLPFSIRVSIGALAYRDGLGLVAPQ